MTNVLEIIKLFVNHFYYLYDKCSLSRWYYQAIFQL